MPEKRQLAAIMFTDIVGYSSLMGKDEAAAYQLLKKNRQVQKPLMKKYGGKWLKEMGDGVLASFQTITDAVYCAIEIQRRCIEEADLQLRIGIHQGEVIVEGGDVFGDGVNIASRIEPLAPGGGIYISDTVYRNIKNRKGIITEFVCEESLKNVDHPVRIYQVNVEASDLSELTEDNKQRIKIVKKAGSYSKLVAGISIAIVLLIAAYLVYDKFLVVSPKAEIQSTEEKEKSIAVLPFVNMSDDQEQEYFSDGLSEELINVLAKIPLLKVIGRTSSFAFKGKNTDLREIGKMLGVSYLVEGSVRKSGNILRITAQLIKADDGSHLYSEKFDRNLEDVFVIQDEISMAILDAIKIELLGAEKRNILKRYTDNVEAYQQYLNGLYNYNKFTPDGFLKAIDYLNAAVAIDSTYAIAYSALAFCYMNLKDFNWYPGDESLRLALVSAEKASQLAQESAESLIATGRIKLHWDYNLVGAQNDFKKAIAINPNSAECHVQLGMCAVLMGDVQEATDHISIAESLDPFSLLNIWYLTTIPWAAGDYEKMLENARRLIDMEPNFFGGHFWVAVALRSLKKYQEALSEAELAVKLNYGIFTLGDLGTTYGLMGEEQKAMEVIEKMKELQKTLPGGNLGFGMVYASVGKIDSAFQYWDRAYNSKEGNMLWIEPILKYFPELQQDPRTRELIAKVFSVQ